LIKPLGVGGNMQGYNNHCQRNQRSNGNQLKSSDKPDSFFPHRLTPHPAHEKEQFKDH
jgi:hypothetical protein